jgi:predicted transcriptional regulator
MAKTPKRAPGQPKRGPLPWEPTTEERARVKLCVGLGYNQSEIALLLGKSEDSLQRHCRHELDAGKLEIDAKIGAKLVDKCMKGDTASILFWHKVRRGWRETNRTEHTGPNGGPIETLTYDLSKLTDEELDDLERIRSRITVAGGDPGGEGTAQD